MDEITNIIQKKLKDEKLSSKDEQIFAAWISTPKNRETFDDYKQIWTLTGDITKTLTPDINLQWNKFKLARKAPTNTKHKIRYFINSKFAAAAVTILVLGIVVLLKYFSGSSDVYFSSNATLEIKLPDNSLVILNKNSSLSVPKQFNKRNRTVKLKGEAIFDITKNPDSPFVVELNSSTNVTVLGTKFNLRAYNVCKAIELKVLSGKVLFKKHNNKVIVEKGMGVDLNKKENKFTELKPLDKNMLAWETQKLDFDNTPISDIATALERFLNKKIELPKNTSDIRYTGTFDNPKEKEIASVLALALGWDYKITKESIVFSVK